MTLFSIIIPTYSRHRDLTGCLDAIARLSLRSAKFEVLVVNDGNKCPPHEIVEGFRDRMPIKLIQAPRGGPASARNRGVEHANGRFLAFTDDDCRPAPNWLQAMAARCAVTPDQIIGGRTANALTENPFAATSQLILDVVYDHYNPPGEGQSAFFATNNLVVPADGFRSVGGFDATFKTSEDRELCDRWLWRGYKMTYAPEALVYHANPLGLRKFWWQHFGYGRGARRYHLVRERRGSGKFRPDWRFYRHLSIAPFRDASRPQGTIAALLLVAQIANAAGFFYELINSRSSDQRPA